MPKPKDCVRDKYSVSDVERCTWEIYSGSAGNGQTNNFQIAYFFLSDRGAYFLSSNRHTRMTIRSLTASQEVSSGSDRV